MKILRIITIVVFIVFVLVGHHLIGTVTEIPTDQTTSIAIFINHTNDTYTVFQRAQPMTSTGGPVYTAASADWQPVLFVHPNEKGEFNIAVQDPDTYGMQIKLEPHCSKMLPTYYISGGIRAGGDCGQRWLKGPYSINVSLDERGSSALLDKRAQQVRYCAYKTASAIVEIYDDGLTFKDDHNLNILDEEKITIDRIKKGCKS